MGEIWTGGEPVPAPTSMWSCLRGIRTYMENEGNKKGRDKLKDKKKSFSCKIQSVFTSTK